MFSAKILLDSISETGKRLTTFEITFPLIVLAEFNTHRALSRNSASSRAIPFKKQLERVLKSPFIPERFPINGKGMQPQGYYEITSIEHQKATEIWLKARDYAVKQAKKLTGESEAWFEDSGSDFRSDALRYLNIHKQIANRLLQPFLWHTVICTATELDNFFKLRTDEDAQAEIKTIADMMYEEYHRTYTPCPDGLVGCEVLHDASLYKPKQLKVGEWHCPLVSKEDEQSIYDFYVEGFNEWRQWGKFKDESAVLLEIKKRISVARCARVSYLTHDGKRNIEKDLELFDRLITSGHWSPTEHVATPFFETKPKPHSRFDTKLCYLDLPSGNFIGWKQYRKEFPDENTTHFRKDYGI